MIHARKHDLSADQRRSIGEILCLLDVMQTTDRDKVATPANGRPRFKAVIPALQTVGEGMQRLDSGDNCMGWYLCYNQQGTLTSGKDNGSAG